MYKRQIYDTVPWKAFGEGKTNVKGGFFQDNKNKPYTEKDFRFTYKNGIIYAFQMKPTRKNIVRLKSFKQVEEDLIIKSIRLLGDDRELAFERNKKYMQIKLSDIPKTDLPICFKIELD